MRLSQPIGQHLLPEMWQQNDSRWNLVQWLHGFVSIDQLWIVDAPKARIRSSGLRRAITHEPSQDGGVKLEGI